MDDKPLQEDLRVRLRRIEGQVRGIQRMLDSDRVCEDILTQLIAVRNGLDQVALRLTELHIERCILSDLPIEQERLEQIRAGLRLLTRLAPTPSEPLPE